MLYHVLGPELQKRASNALRKESEECLEVGDCLVECPDVNGAGDTHVRLNMCGAFGFHKLLRERAYQVGVGGKSSL